MKLSKKNVLLVVMALLVSIMLFACGEDTGGSNKPQKENEEPAAVEEPQDSKEPETSSDILTFGSEFTFDGFNVILGDDYTFDVLDNEFSDLDNEPVIRIPINITNNSGETRSFNMFYYTVFDQSGNASEGVASYFDNSLAFSGDMRDGATQDLFIYIHYTEDGTYYIEFDNWEEKVEIELPIKKS